MPPVARRTCTAAACAMQTCDFNARLFLTFANPRGPHER